MAYYSNSLFYTGTSTDTQLVMYLVCRRDINRQRRLKEYTAKCSTFTVLFVEYYACLCKTYHKTFASDIIMSCSLYSLIINQAHISQLNDLK